MNVKKLKQNVMNLFFVEDKYIFWAMMALILFGTIMIVSVRSGTSSSLYGLMFSLAKQIIFVIVSLLVYLFFQTYFKIKIPSSLLKLIGFVLLVLLVSTIFSKESNGSRSWIQIGGIMSIQPVELVKVYVIVLFANHASKVAFSDKLVYKKYRFGENMSFRIPLIVFPILYTLLCVAIVIFLHNDKGSAIILAGISYFCLLIPSNQCYRRFQNVLLFIPVIAIPLALFAITPLGTEIISKIPGFGHIAARIQNMRNPFLNDQYANAGGFQMIQGLYGIASHSFDFGKSIQKYGWVSEADSDYIMAIVIEETSYFGLLFVVCGYGIIVWRLIMHCLKSKSAGMKVVFVGTIAYMLLHFVLNIGGIGGLIPLTGVPIMMVSSGGTSLFSIVALLGICQGCIRKMRIQGVGVKKRKRATKGS